MSNLFDQLSPDMRQTLLNIVNRESPTLSSVVDGDQVLTLEQRDLVIDVLAREFVSRGLEDGDEPNDYGRHVDAIIGRISYRWALGEEI